MKKIETELKNRIHNLDVVAFDIFDTILTRTVNPESIKKIWAKEINRQYCLTSNNSELYKIRFDLEAQMCQQNQKNGFDLDFNVEKLYFELANQFKIEDVNRFVETCIAQEIAIESRCQVIDQNWLDAIRKIKQEYPNIKIICISDMYLTKNMLTEILKNHGVFNLLDGLYVSSEYLITKRSGKLYSHLLQELGWNPEKVLMVGDNKISDVENSQSLGMMVYHIDREAQHQQYNTWEKTINDTYIQKEIKELFKMNPEESFENIAAALYLYIEKLYNKLKYNQVEDVFFLSREGEFLKVLFDYYQTSIGVEKINSHYLIVSRKSTFLPSLKALEEEDFYNLFRQYIHMSISEFLNSLNFIPSDIELLKNSLDLDFKNKITDFPNSKEFKVLKNNDVFKTIYETNRVLQKENFIQYVKSFNVDLMKGLHIVDVGWKGTIQDNIYNILNQEINVVGYYTGLVASGNATNHNQKMGLLFSLYPEKTSNYMIYSENRALFEMILGASHGSANRYLRNGDEIELELFNKEEEKVLFETIVQPMQVKIYERFTKLNELLLNKAYDDRVVERTLNDVHAQLVFFPTKRQLSFFEKMYHYENFGVFEFSTFNTSMNKNFKAKVKEYQLFMKQPITYLGNSFWPLYKLYQNDLVALSKVYQGARYIQLKINRLI
ncbi:HAD family hydrolase [Turicibacter sanguinis]|uniref:HAD family hydrolase n=1 Tax=Turicibacter sanguinis TaxID=154288 RepID=UPI0018AC0CCA|nr:HAD family hydrolase [Turicibacter sanguinis]MDB8558563.1 HAD hydrolase-like protein [Turicibacter sanguinis]MDB8561359.1 HAD hydrolase-like protein [Turicibacter sanguinis]